MYHRADFDKIGIGVYPVAAGRFSGDGTVAGRRLVSEYLAFSLGLKGTAHNRTHFGEILVRTGEIVSWWPRMWWDLTEFQGVPLKTIWFQVDGPAVPSVASCFGITPTQIVLRPTNVPEARHIFEDIVSGFQSHEALPPVHFLNRFFRLSELCIGNRWEAASPVHVMETLVQRAIRICKSQMLTFPTVPELASRLGVCQNTLLNACRRELGGTAVDLLRSLKIEKAKGLLRTTDYKLVYIAKACGFNSLSHFMCSFHQAAGMTPTEWREKTETKE
jgi:AraC-like DNA-binding protein